MPAATEQTQYDLTLIFRNGAEVQFQMPHAEILATALDERWTRELAGAIRGVFLDYLESVTHANEADLYQISKKPEHAP